jgi:hypothetical protein
VTETKPSHTASDPSTLVHNVNVAHEVDLQRGKPTDHDASAMALQECGDVPGERVNLLPEFVASVKRAALEEAEKPGQVQPDARCSISPVCDDDNDGKKFDEVIVGVNSTEQAH